jgi:hypothetical protein
MCSTTAGFVAVNIGFAPMDTCRCEEQHEYVVSYLAKTLENYLLEWIFVLNKSDRAKCINHLLKVNLVSNELFHYTFFINFAKSFEHYKTSLFGSFA